MIGKRSLYSIEGGNAPITKGIYLLFIFAFFILSNLCASAQLVRPKWVDNLKENGSNNSVTYLAVDKQNNVYVTGEFLGTIDMDPSAGVKNLTSVGDYDVFIGKYKQDGTLIWAESIGGKSADVTYGLAVDKDGNVSIVGSFYSSLDADPGPGVYNLIDPIKNEVGFLIHLDTNGGFLWANCFDLINDTKNIGGVSIRVASDSQDNVITTSEFSGNLVVGDSTYTSTQGAGGLITKYGAAGNVLWSVHLQAKGNSIYDTVEPFGVRIDSQDNILISGTFIGTVNFNPLGVAYNLTAPNSTASSFVAKYSPAGTLSWASNIIEGSSGYGTLPTAICIDQQDNIYFSIQFATSLTFGSVSVTATGDNLYTCIAKYSPSGIVQFAKAIAVGQGDFLGETEKFGGPCELAADQDNNIYLTGDFRGTVNFNMNPGTTENLTVHGYQDFFVAKYDANGNYIHAFNCGPPNSVNSGNTTSGISIAVDNDNNIDVGGEFGPSMNFDPTACSTDTATAVSTDKDEGFFAQYNTITIANNVITPPAISSICTNGTPAAITGSLPTGGNGTFIYQWLSSADSVTFADISGATAQNYTPSQLTANTYYERMVSSDTCTTPTVSNIIGLHVLPSLAATVVSVAATTSSSIIFTWTAVPGATDYQVSTNGGQTYTIVTGLADTVTNLQPGQSVTISIQAAGSIPCQLSTSATATGSVPSSDVVYIANAFTPNGDGRDDILHVKGENIQSLKFSIYDQWGELLFSTTNQQNGWDGTYKGTKEPVGVYVYYLDAVLNDGTSVKKKGTVTLLK